MLKMCMELEEVSLEAVARDILDVCSALGRKVPQEPFVTEIPLMCQKEGGPFRPIMELWEQGAVFSSLSSSSLFAGLVLGLSSSSTVA